MLKIAPVNINNGVFFYKVDDFKGIFLNNEEVANCSSSGQMSLNINGIVSC